MSFMKVVGGVAGVAGGVSILEWARRHSPNKGIIDSIATRFESYVIEKSTFHIAVASAIVLILAGAALAIRGLMEDR